MAEPLTPAPSSLGLASPALGPWFTDEADTDRAQPDLGLPEGTLAVPVTLQTDMAWRTPVGATRAYFRATEPRPTGLAQLRRADGKAAFETGGLVVLLTLMPEVEARLWALTASLPSPDGTPADGAPARPRIRYFALEIPADRSTSMTAIAELRPEPLPQDLTGAAAQAAYLGLEVPDSGGAPTNAARPVRELLRPATPLAQLLQEFAGLVAEHTDAVALDETVINHRAIAVQNRQAGHLTARLWCFDHRGRPVDPGAVATWWQRLATEDWTNLWASSLPDRQRTAAAAAGRIVHLTSAHEGPIEPHLRARLDRSDLTEMAGSATADPSLVHVAGDAPAIAITDPSEDGPDTAPLPRIAALPRGAYAHPDDAQPFAGWRNTETPFSLARDFLRIGVVDLERQVTGLNRVESGSQADPRLRIPVRRNTHPAPVLMSSDAVAVAVMATLAAEGSTSAMAPVMDRDWGPTPTAAPGNAALPETVAFTVHALAGAGAESDGLAVDQRVLVRFDEALPQGLWVRLWPHGRHAQTARRVRLNGGAGLSGASGCLLVMRLPNGTATTADEPVELSCDVLIVGATGHRFYMDQRFPRPPLLDAEAVALPENGDPPSGFELHVAERGAVFNRGSDRLRPGETLIALPEDDDEPARLVAAGSLLPADRAEASLPNAATAQTRLITTTPAFAQTPGGSLPAEPASDGPARLHRTRAGFALQAGFGGPLPSQERLEVVALAPLAQAGVVGGLAGHGSQHEAPPAHLGHPGVPAAAEIHGPGMALAGPAAEALGPLMRERGAATLQAFVQAAATAAQAPAADPGGTSTWTAVLETLAPMMAGDAVLRAIAVAAPPLQPGQTWLQIKSRLEQELGTGVVDEWLASLAELTFDDEALARVIDLALHKTRHGRRDFARAARDAIARAEDFVYLQTPAFDPHSDAQTLDLVAAITARWSERPALVVVLCVPERWLPQRNAKLEQVRRGGVGAALHVLRNAAAERVVLFAPVAGPGRRLHLASTTLIVDDALLICGSTHGWRRGLTFDSSLAVSLFDEQVRAGRPAAVRAARRNALALMLGVEEALIPDDMAEVLEAVRAMNAGDGFGRVRAGAYKAVADPTTEPDLALWNPNGAALVGDEALLSAWLQLIAVAPGMNATDVGPVIN